MQSLNQYEVESSDVLLFGNRQLNPVPASLAAERLVLSAGSEEDLSDGSCVKGILVGLAVEAGLLLCLYGMFLAWRMIH